ncbi:MAG: hypothetical protein NT002_00645 [candidate division Zixibacteria bacterium]|nr:hypothetical protein [candidate division Zixibacteria bacterium]
MKSPIGLRAVVKWALVLAIFAIVVAAGIYTGFALTGHKFGSSLGLEVDDFTLKEENLHPLIEEGDSFPPVPCLLANGTAGDIAEMIKDRRSLVVFTANDCSPCSELFDYLQAKAKSISKFGIFLIVAVPTDSYPYDEDLSNFKNAAVVQFENDYVTDFHNIRARPIMFALDQYGFVKAIQFGFDGVTNQYIAEFIGN